MDVYGVTVVVLDFHSLQIQHLAAVNDSSKYQIQNLLSNLLSRILFHKKTDRKLATKIALKIENTVNNSVQS